MTTEQKEAVYATLRRDEKETNDPSALREIISGYEALGQFRDALRSARLLMANPYSSGEGLLQQAVALKRLGRYKESLAAARAAYKIPGPHQESAYSFIQLNKPHMEENARSRSALIVAPGSAPSGDRKIAVSFPQEKGLRIAAAPPPAPANGKPRHFPLLPLSIFGMGLVAYGVAKSRSPFVSEDGGKPTPVVPLGRIGQIIRNTIVGLTLVGLTVVTAIGFHREAPAMVTATANFFSRFGQQGANIFQSEMGSVTPAANEAAAESSEFAVQAKPVVEEAGQIAIKRGEIVSRFMRSELEGAPGSFRPARYDLSTAGQTVIGKFPDYVTLARRTDANYFSIPKPVWDDMSEAEHWAANQRFLDRAIARGDDFVLASDALTRSSGYYLKELQYLFAHGYEFNNIGNRLIKAR